MRTHTQLPTRHSLDRLSGPPLPLLAFLLAVFCIFSVFNSLVYFCIFISLLYCFFLSLSFRWQPSFGYFWLYMNSLSLLPQIQQASFISLAGWVMNKTEDRGIKSCNIRSSHWDDVQTVRSKYRNKSSLGKFALPWYDIVVVRIAFIHFFLASLIHFAPW